MMVYDTFIDFINYNNYETWKLVIDYSLRWSVLILLGKNVENLTKIFFKKIPMILYVIFFKNFIINVHKMQTPRNHFERSDKQQNECVQFSL